MLVFVEWRIPENPEKNPRSKARSNNKLNPPWHRAGIEHTRLEPHPCCTRWTLRQILSVTLWFIYLFTDDVLPPGMHVRGDGERKQSSSNKLIVGLVVTFIILLLIAIGIIGFLWYRRKRSHQFEYKKQVIYSDDKAEEFEIFTWRLTNFPFISACSTCLQVV